jgi:hypothetical protein
VVARCSCGVLGCGDIEVVISRAGDFVEWRQDLSVGEDSRRVFVASDGTNSQGVRIEKDYEPSARILKFLATDYFAEVERAINDTCWETPDRSAARLIRTAVPRSILEANGLTFCWASARLRSEEFTLSLSLQPGPYQVLVHLPWDGVTSDNIARQALDLLAENPANWPNVEWIPQQRE